MKVRVPNIYIQIPEYDFSGESSSQFLGRTEAFNLLQRRLSSNGRPIEKYHGCYLVAGYRGMGKTRLVNKVVSNLVEKSSNCITYIPINISLSQASLSEEQVLRQVFTGFFQTIEDGIKERKSKNSKIRVISVFMGAFAACFSIVFFNYCSCDIISRFGSVFSSIVLIIFSLLLSRIGLWIMKRRKNSAEESLDKKVYLILSRIFSKFETGSGYTAKFLEGIGAGSSLINSFTQQFSSSENQGVQNFDIISNKELEIELAHLFKLYRKAYPENRLIFIIDELDKLEPEFIEGDSDYFSLGKSRMETRKESLVKILADLKSFTHTSEAKYVFIGGAELYDASLADTADRESFYSSIFHEVIYLETFFKANEGSKIGITQMIINYLGGVLFDEQVAQKGTLFCELCKRMEQGNVSKEHRNYLIACIYKFVVYLTYRSNGSPKKLRELIEYMISHDGVESAHQEDLKYCRDDNGTLISLDSGICTSITLCFCETCQCYNLNNRSSHFLKISYKEQYKIGLQAKLFVPYLLGKNRMLKGLNDRNLYLTAYMMDHILKFHRSAFSWNQLELTPDIILGKPGPFLRDTLEEILDYLTIDHIRVTSNAMFKYKFRSRTKMELKYISKISDISSAVYNFTYDESFHLKAFFKRKLRQKIKLYSEGAYQNSDTNFIHSIAFLNANIADLHYYDEEYASAIRYYLDSIQRLRDLLKYPNQVLSRHQQMLYARNRLLLSMCYEKAGRYNPAYSTIRSIILDLQGTPFIKADGQTSSWESPFRRMQLFMRPLLALLTIIEKDRTDGITVDNLKRNIEEYSSFLGVKDLFPHSEKFSFYQYREFSNSPKADHKRIQTLLGDYYESVGSILFYKNRLFKSLFELGSEMIFHRFLKLDISDFSVSCNHFWSQFFNRKDDKVICFNQLKYKLGIHSQRFFHPSYLAFYYYIISLGHLLMPFHENIHAIRGCNTSLDYSKISLFGDLKSLVCDPKCQHILNGPQMTNIAKVLSSLADSILGSLHVVHFPSSCLNDFNSFESELSFENLFSIKSFIIFSLWAQNLYERAGNRFASLLQYKKLLYLFRACRSDYLFPTKDTRDAQVDLLKSLSSEVSFIALDFINTSGIDLSEDILKDIGTLSVDSSSTKPSCVVARMYFTSSDVLEVKLLANSIDSTQYQELFNFYSNSIPAIDSIFGRIQELRYKLDWLMKNKGNYLEVERGLTYLSNIIKGYGFGYIINYTYYASILQRVARYFKENNYSSKDYSMSLKRLLTDSFSYYKKSLRLHTEGNEYKQTVQKMFLLDDDFNSSLTHFSAALDRMLMNTGYIQEQIRLIEIELKAFTNESDQASS